MDWDLTPQQLLIRWANVRAQIERVPEYTKTDYGTTGLAYGGHPETRHIVTDTTQVESLCTERHTRGDDLKLLGDVHMWRSKLPASWDVNLDDQQYLMFGTPTLNPPQLPNGFVFRSTGNSLSLTVDVVSSTNTAKNDSSEHPEITSKVVSSAQAGIDDELAVVHNVFTVPEFQRQGFATSLMAQIVSWMASQEVSHLALVSSPVGKAFYEHLGLHTVDSVTAATYLPKP